jgi:hypothetical protein
MRYGVAVLALLAASSFASPSQADPYLWCAIYGGAETSQNCVFKTLEECREATVTGGVCTPNYAYDRRDTSGYGRRHKALRY